MSYEGPVGRVSGGLETGWSKGVLGFDGIKMNRITGTGRLMLFIYPM
jgi:hypothetical protein